MLGLLLKDLFNLKSQVKLYAIFPFLAIFIAFQTQSLTIMQVYTGIIIISVMVSACYYDEMADFNPYALTLPLTKHNIVLSKYILLNILIVISSILCVVIALILISIAGTDTFVGFEWKEFIITTISLACMMNVISCVLLPILFKYGTEKGRTMMVFVFLGIGIVAYLLSSFDVSWISKDIIQFVENVIQSIEGYSLYIIAILSVIMQIGSLNLSYKIMKNKEF